MTINTTTPNIFPVLRYADAPAAIDWLVRAFGLTQREMFADAAGGVAHAELDLGAGVIGISSARGPVAGNPWTSVDQGVYIRVDDVDADYARARSAGAEIVSPLTATGYGTREYTLRDDEGHLWGFGTYGMGASSGESRRARPGRARGACFSGGRRDRSTPGRHELRIPGLLGARSRRIPLEFRHLRAATRRPHRKGGQRPAPGFLSPDAASGACLSRLCATCRLSRRPEGDWQCSTDERSEPAERLE